MKDCKSINTIFDVKSKIVKLKKEEYEGIQPRSDT